MKHARQIRKMMSGHDEFHIMTHLAVFWMTVCFSLYAVVGRQTQEENPPLLKPFIFIFLRQSLASLLLAALARKFEGAFPSAQFRSNVKHFVFCGCIGICLSQNFFIFGERYTTATTAVTFEPLVPIITGVISFCTGGTGFGKSLREKARKVVGVLIGMFGAIYTARGSARAAMHIASPEHTHVLGNIFCISQVFCIASYLILLKKIPLKILTRFPLWTTCCIVSCGAFLTLCIFTFSAILVPTRDWNTGRKRFAITLPFILEVAFAVVFATVQNYLIRTHAVKVLSPTAIGMYVVLNPPLTAVAASILLGEEITNAEIVGALFVAIGLVTFSYSDLRRIRRSSASADHSDKRFSTRQKARFDSSERLLADEEDTQPLLGDGDEI